MKTDLQKLLALALDGDSKAQGKLTAMVVRGDNEIWVSIISGAAVCALEANELARLPSYISESSCTGLLPFVKLVKSEKVLQRLRKRFKDFVCSL